MTKERFASVWDAIADTPAEAENMKLRSALMMALKDHIQRRKLSQSQAAKLFGVTPAARLRSDAGQDRPVQPRQSGEHGGGRRFACRNAREDGRVRAIGGQDLNRHDAIVAGL